MTPGGKDESRVPEHKRLGREVDTKERVDQLIETTTFVVFSYVAQVSYGTSSLFGKIPSITSAGTL